MNPYKGTLEYISPKGANTLRVLFLGTSGIDKEDYVRKCADIAYNEKFTRGRSDPNAEQYLKIFDLDGAIKEKIGGTPGYTAYLDNPNRDAQNRLWNETFYDILSKTGKYQNEPHIFLILHGVYYRNKNYFSCINRDLLLKFHPTVIVTLIDDAYDVSSTIGQRERTLKTRSICSFAEAIEWRTVEILMGDILARNLYIDPTQFTLGTENLAEFNAELSRLFRRPIPHFTLAVKHGPQVLYRLLFERWRLVLYSAYPITSTRTGQAKIAEINEYRKSVNESFTVFDPAMIDELLVVDKSKTPSEEIERIKTNGFMAEERGQYALLKRLPVVFDINDPDKLAEHSEYMDDFIELKELIKRQIVQRDFRLVRQSTGLTAYRPYWGGKKTPSGGVDREMIEAIGQNTPTYVVHASEKDGEPEVMFRGMETAIITTSLKELLQELEIWQKNTREERSEPDTWED